MLPPILRQASQFILAQSQPEYYRFLYDEIDFNERFICVKGARGAGKTTLLIQYAHSKKIPMDKILYVACDHPAMVDVSLYELADVVQVSGANGGREPDSLCTGRCGNADPQQANKLMLNNPNMIFALCASPNTGAIRETFFVSQMSWSHEVHYHSQGDFMVDEKYVFEIGGSGKTKGQPGEQSQAFVVADGIESGAPWQIPLWVFGMGY